VRVVLAVAFALLFGLRATAFAHATLVRAEPAVGSRLAACPSQVRLLFSEELEPSLARISIVGADGRSTVLAVSGDPRDVHAVVAPVDCLGGGAYRVTWRVVSADGHPVGGTYGFAIGAAPVLSAPPMVTENAVHDALVSDRASDMTWGPSAYGAPLVPALLRGLALGTLMALSGLLFFADRGRDAVVVPFNAGAENWSRRLALWLAVLAPLLLAAHFVSWTINADASHQLTRDSASAAMASSVGRMELWRIALAALALWAFALARRPRLAFFFSLAALLVSGASGHSAAIHSALAIPAKALHLVAGAAWIGGLLWLIALDRADAVFTREAARVSSVAFIAVIAVTISGVVQSLLFLATPLDLVRSAYGAIILAKVAGMIVLLAFGAHHRYRVLPRLSVDQSASSRFTGTLRSEVAVMSIVVLLGGLLAYVPPSEAPVSVSNSPISPE
jgi:copper transport protein